MNLVPASFDIERVDDNAGKPLLAVLFQAALPSEKVRVWKHHCFQHSTGAGCGNHGCAGCCMHGISSAALPFGPCVSESLVSSTAHAWARACVRAWSVPYAKSTHPKGLSVYSCCLACSSVLN